MANQGFGHKIEMSLDNVNFMQVAGLQELTLPNVQKDVIEVTAHNAGVRNNLGGLVENTDLTFTTQEYRGFYPKGSNGYAELNSQYNAASYLHKAIDVNGTFQDIGAGNLGGTGWTGDNGSGLSISSGIATLDLDADTFHPTYLVKSGVFSGATNKPHSISYRVTASSITTSVLRYEYGNLGGAYPTLPIPTSVGTHTLYAANSSTKVNFYLSGAASDSISITDVTVKRLYSFEDIFLTNEDVYVRVKDSSDTTRMTFTGCIMGVSKESPLDDIVTTLVTIKPKSSISY